MSVERTAEIHGGDAEAVEALHAQGLTDGLPVIPPTPERIASFVAAAGCDGDEVIAVVPPMYGDATVGVVAANAVMAGCLPEHMPVVMAGVRAMCRDEFNLFGVRTSNHPASPWFVVSGAVGRDLGFNHSTNLFGPASRANAAVGRALNLIVQNVGGATPQLVDQSTMGQPGRYTACFAEDPDSPWDPLHVARGLPADASAVTCFAGDAPTAVIDYASIEPEALVAAFARTVAFLWSDPFYPMSEILLVPNIAHARILARDGWTRDDVVRRVGGEARGRCGDLPLEAMGHNYEAGLHLTCAGGPWGQYSALIVGWVGPGPGSTMTTEEVVT